MDENKFREYVETRYNAAVRWYDSKSIWNKKYYNITQISIIVLSSMTPVFAILELKWPTTIAASLVAIGTGLIKFMKFEENWLNYRTICETLRKEPHLMDAGLSDYSRCENKYQMFVDRVESLISRENTLWLTTISTKDNNSC